MRLTELDTINSIPLILINGIGIQFRQSNGIEFQFREVDGIEINSVNHGVDEST